MAACARDIRARTAFRLVDARMWLFLILFGGIAGQAP